LAKNQIIEAPLGLMEKLEIRKVARRRKLLLVRLNDSCGWPFGG